MKYICTKKCPENPDARFCEHRQVHEESEGQCSYIWCQGECVPVSEPAQPLAAFGKGITFEKVRVWKDITKSIEFRPLYARDGKVMVDMFDGNIRVGCFGIGAPVDYLAAGGILCDQTEDARYRLEVILASVGCGWWFRVWKREVA